MSLICFCILGIAVVVAILELFALPLIVSATGCRLDSGVLPGFACGQGLVSRLTELFLDLPYGFILAPAFTVLFRTDAPPGRDFMMVLYVLDVILVLALTYPIMLFFGRKHAKN